VGTWENLARLYAQHSQVVYRRARYLLADDEAARDTTQEVFMRVMRGGGSVPAQPTPTAWLHCVTTNLCLNQLRDRNRHTDLLTHRYAPETTVAASGEARATLQELMRLVPEELHDVAVYFFVDELTYDEIADLIGVSKRTVSNRLTAFRELVGRLFPDLRLAS
jgi:RNA polymerase sigma-70 factor (ECF subfamily)